MMAPGFSMWWYTSKKRRFAFVAIAAAAFAAVYSAGAESKMTQDEARDLKDDFLEQTRDIDAFGIFLNNFRIAAMMFIPGFGVVAGLFAAYSTGLVFSALAETTPQVAEIPPLLILATPFGLMEITSYGIGMSQSAILTSAIFRRQRLRPLILPTAIQVGIVCAILLAGAFIEYEMIRALPEDPLAVGTAAG